MLGQTLFFLKSNRCSNDDMTNIHENGVGHQARFSFSTFRFAEHQKHSVHLLLALYQQTLSAQHTQRFYGERRTHIQPILPLSAGIFCSYKLHYFVLNLQQCNTRRRRDVESTGVSEDTSLLMLPLVIRNENCKFGCLKTLDFQCWEHSIIVQQQINPIKKHHFWGLCDVQLTKWSDW